MSIFYDRFIELCQSKDVSPTVAANDIGLSATSATYWKRGAVPRQKTLQKLADYFNVPVDIFLAGEDDLSSFPWLLDEPFVIPEWVKRNTSVLRQALDRAAKQLSEMHRKDIPEEVERWEGICSTLRAAIDGEDGTNQNKSMSDRTIELLSIFSEFNDEGQRKAVEWLKEIKRIPDYQRRK